MRFENEASISHDRDLVFERSSLLWRSTQGNNEYLIKQAIPGSLGKFISQTDFKKIQKAYEKQYPALLALFSPQGRQVMGKTVMDSKSETFKLQYRTILDRTLRRGEPWVEEYPDGKTCIWVVPLLMNTRLMGGIVASADKSSALETCNGSKALHSAATDLVRLVEDHNLTNAPFLDLLSRRNRNKADSEPVYAFNYQSADFRSIYIKEEPALLSAIRKGAREEAREAMNRILVVLLTQAGDDLSLLKSFFLEIVVLMCRAAVEAGCDAASILGVNYERCSELFAVQSDETLSPWLHTTLERLIDAIHDHQDTRSSAFLQTALRYMHDHLSEDISRDMTATAAGLSNAHFSRQFKREMRESFTDVLNRLRVDHAAELLARTDRSLYMISFDSGFKNQSYFTKVFKKYMKTTPREYRVGLLTARRNEG